MIKNATYFLESLKRIHAGNHGVSFQNAEESFEMVLRTDPDTTEGMEFEISIFRDEDDDPSGKFRALMKRECNEVDEDEFLLEDFYIPADATPTSKEVIEAIAIVNMCHGYKVCPCNKYMIRDGHQMCLFCNMTADEESMKMDTCVICYEDTPKMGMHPQACCGQTMHRRCLDAWYGHSLTCPICRAVCKVE